MAFKRDPLATKAMPLSIGYDEAAVVLNVRDWAVIYEVLDSFKDQAELSLDEKNYIEKMKDGIESWCRNSGFSDFIGRYVS